MWCRPLASHIEYIRAISNSTDRTNVGKNDGTDTDGQTDRRQTDMLYASDYGAATVINVKRGCFRYSLLNLNERVGWSHCVQLIWQTIDRSYASVSWSFVR